MIRLALILLLCSLSSLAFGTFEIQDPAGDIYKEQQASEAKEVKLDKQVLEEETFCALDTETGDCWCVHRETATVIAIKHEVCFTRAARQE